MYNDNDLQPYDLLPRFTKLKCPKCGQRFVQIDRFGIYCTFRNCSWCKDAPNPPLNLRGLKC